MAKVIFTIDAEGVHGKNPFEKMMYGKIKSNEEYGAIYLAKIFKKFNISATFFVDIYEKYLFGEEPLKKICSQLIELEQDVQLHTHPSWRDDPTDFDFIRELKRKKCGYPQTKDFMYKSSLNEQIEILEEGISDLQKWIGKKPVAHRAGGYGVNFDTFKALSKVGIKIDSSMFYKHPNCKYYTNMNSLSIIENVLELPISCAEFKENLNFFGFNYANRKEIRRITLDDLELRWVYNLINEMKNVNNLIIVIFFHSYSMLKIDKSFSHFSANIKKINLLKDLLNNLSNDLDIEFLSMNDVALLDEKGDLDLNGNDFRIFKSVNLDFFYRLYRKVTR